MHTGLPFRRLAVRATVVLLAVSVLQTAPAGGAGPAEDAQQVAVVTEAHGIEAQEVSDEELVELQAEGPGTVVTRGRAAQAELAQSVPKVGAPTQWNLGHRGAERVIAVIDTGVDAGFGGTIIGQACFAATQEGDDLFGHCGPSRDDLEAFSSTCFDLGVCDAGDVPDPSAGRPCDDPIQPESCAHGTAVAAVAARHEPTPGVAPDAFVYPIQVFDPSGGGADFVDILLALDHVADMSDAGMDFAAANLSLSSNATFSSYCDAGAAPDSDAVAFRTAIQRLEVRGIATVVATGNSGSTSGIGMPACVSNAIAVGATDLDDQIADFSNRSATTDLVAPGADEANGFIDRMEIPGNPVTDQWAGTSFSAPHVAGAFALIEEEYPKASIAQMTSLLRAAGVVADDPKTTASYRRLDLGDLARGLAARHLFMGSAGVTGSSRTGVGDLDGDGRTDVVVHGPGSGADAVSYGRTTWGFDRIAATLTGDLRPLIGQLSGSSSSPDDVLWYAPGPAADRLWTGQASRVPQSTAISVSGTYDPAVGDFDGDGWDDILWYAPGGTADPIWYGGPAGFTVGTPTDIRGSYHPLVADVDGDSRDDLILYGSGSAHSIWYGQPGRSFAKTTISAPGGRRIALGDVNGDDRADIVLHGPGAASDSLLLGSASRLPTTVGMTVGGTYEPVLIDIDGDGRDDVIWYAAGSTPDAVWTNFADGTPAGRHTISVTGTYRPMVGDFDGDGFDDLVWSNAASASTPVWWSYVPPAP